MLSDHPSEYLTFRLVRDTGKFDGRTWDQFPEAVTSDA